MGGRAAKTRVAMDALDASTRVSMEGHRPGAYLRLRFSGKRQLQHSCAQGAQRPSPCCPIRFVREPHFQLAMSPAGMPAELVTHFDPRLPLLAGAVAPAEAGTGYLRLRLKRHRWFPKTLKTRDPLIFSIGAASLALDSLFGGMCRSKDFEESRYCAGWECQARPQPEVPVLTSTSAIQSDLVF